MTPRRPIEIARATRSPPRRLRAVISWLAVLGMPFLLGYGYVNSGITRDAGWPNDIDDLVGRWELVDTNGSFSGPVPDAFLITATTPSPPYARGWSPVSGVMTSDPGSSPFVAEGLGLLRFEDGASCPFGDLVDPHDRRGRPFGIHSMTHFCVPISSFDHWTFFPDGPPIDPDPNRRSLTYERE